MIMMMGQLMKMLLGATQPAPAGQRQPFGPTIPEIEAAREHVRGSTERSNSSSSSSGRARHRQRQAPLRDTPTITIRFERPSSSTSPRRTSPEPPSPEDQCDRVSNAIRASGRSMVGKIEQMYGQFRDRQQRQTEAMVTEMDAARAAFSAKRNQLMAWTRAMPPQPSECPSDGSTPRPAAGGNDRPS